MLSTDPETKGKTPTWVQMRGLPAYFRNTTRLRPRRLRLVPLLLKKAYIRRTYLKMRFPEKVVIDGREWKIVLNKNTNGANFLPYKRKISIGTAEDVGLENFIHETLEVIMQYNLAVFFNHNKPTENGDRMFVMNHQKFEKICSDFGMVIRTLLKTNGVKV